MTRITLLHSYYATSTPSGENVAVELQADALHQAGFSTTIVAVRTDDRAERPFHSLLTGIGVATRSGIDPARRLAETRPDIVHVHNLFPNFATGWLAKWPGPIVATVHNYRPLCAAGTLARDGTECTDCVGLTLPIPAVRHRCYRRSIAASASVAVSAVGGVNRNPLLRRADRLIFLSRRATGIYHDAGFQGLGRSVVLPNFVCTSPVPRLQPHQRQNLPWVYFGRLAPEKGVVRLLRHWPPDVPLIVYGAGPDTDDVRRLATGSVTYGGLLKRDALLQLLPRHRGLIFPTMFAEGLPTVYLESLAAGLPVIARAGNSAADDIVAHDTGVVFSDFEGVSAAIRKLEERYVAHSSAAFERYRSGFSRDAWLNGITSVYSAAATSPMRG